MVSFIEDTTIISYIHIMSHSLVSEANIMSHEYMT